MNKRRFGLAALFLAVITACSSAAAKSIVLGGYPDRLLLVDEERGVLTDRITLESGLPVTMQMANDGSRIYITTITTSGIEVFDTAQRKIINSFSLNTPTTRYRIGGGAPDPTGRYLYTIGTRIDKELDHYRVSDLQYLVIDLEERKVVRSADVDEKDSGSRWRAQLLVSEDGKTLYILRDKVLVLDTDTLKVVDRIELSTPAEPGMRDVTFGSSIDSLRTPDEYVSVFNAEDPYIHNKVFGIARFHLNSRTFSFTPIGPAPDRMSGLAVTPDGKTAYSVTSHGTLGNKRCEFWRFDLATNKATRKEEFPCRSRFTFGMSSNGKKLYIYAAGFEVEVYNADTLKLERVWNLNNDITGAGMLFVK